MAKHYRFIGKCAYALQREAREEMKLRLLKDILMDIKICELEGWDKLEYLNELKDLIDSFLKQ